MTTLGIAILVVMVAGGFISAFFVWKTEIIPPFMCGIMRMIFFPILWILFLFILGPCHKGRETYVESRINIRSIANTSQMDGSFFLGTGYIDEQEYFVFYEEVGGMLRLNKMLNEGNVFVRESEGTPCIERWYRKPADIGGLARWFVDTPKFYSIPDKTIINVPHNAVIRSYNLDINNL